MTTSKLREILENMKKGVNELETTMMGSEGQIIYLSMSLADKVFYKEGYNQAIKEVTALLEPKEDKNNN